MKYLILLAVIATALWWIRSQRQPPLPPTPRAPQAPKNEEMIACAQCGVHLPRSEALPGRGGIFCSEAHRAAFEQRQSPR